MDNINIRNQVMEKLIEDGMLLDKYPQYQDDNEMVWAAITNNGNAIQYASNRIKMDEIVVQQAVDQNIEALQYCEYYKNDLDFCLKFQQVRSILQYVSTKLQKDSTLLYCVLHDYAEGFNYLPTEIKNNDFVISSALKHNHKIFEYVDDKIKNSFVKMLKFIQGTQYDDMVEKNVLQYLGKDLKKDRDFALIAVSRNGYYLQFFDESLKDDKIVVWTAISENGNALEYASDRLKDDQETVLNAVSTGNHSVYGTDDTDVNSSFKYASDRLRGDLDTLIKVLDSHNGIYNATKEVLDSEYIIEQLIKIDDSSISSASDRIKDDKKIMLKFLKYTDKAFSYASNELHNDIEFVSVALEKYPMKIKNIKNSLGNELKKEIGDIDLMSYINSYQLSQKLYNEIPQKPLEVKPKIKI